MIGARHFGRKLTRCRRWSVLERTRSLGFGLPSISSVRHRKRATYLKSEWLKPYDAVPARDTLQIYGGSDYAVTADGGDYTAHCVVGLDPDGRMYLLDLWRKQGV